MSARRLAKTKIIYYEYGVVAKRSVAGFLVFLPRAVSTGHQLCIVAALWEVWASVRNYAGGIESDWTIDVSEFYDLPFPLIAVISSIDADLSQTGQKLRVVGGRPHTPLSELSLRPSRARPYGNATQVLLGCNDE